GAHSPYIRRRRGCRPIKIVTKRAGIGAGDDAPGRAVPVLHQGSETAGGSLACDPHVARRNSCYSGKLVITRAPVRTRDYAPNRAIPVLDEGLKGASTV